MAVSWVIDGTKPHRVVPLASECSPSIPVSDLYFEIVYGPLIGPTSVALARNLARRATSAVEAVHIDVVEVALEIGVRASHLGTPGRTSPISRAFDRLYHHRLLAVLGEWVIGTYVSVPPLDRIYLAHLPATALDFHRSRLSIAETGGLLS